MQAKWTQLSQWQALVQWAKDVSKATPAPGTARVSSEPVGLHGCRSRQCGALTLAVLSRAKDCCSFGSPPPLAFIYTIAVALLCGCVFRNPSTVLRSSCFRDNLKYLTGYRPGRSQSAIIHWEAPIIPSGNPISPMGTIPKLF